MVDVFSPEFIGYQDIDRLPFELIGRITEGLLGDAVGCLDDAAGSCQENTDRGCLKYRFHVQQASRIRINDALKGDEKFSIAFLTLHVGDAPLDLIGSPILAVIDGGADEGVLMHQRIAQCLQYAGVGIGALKKARSLPEELLFAIAGHSAEGRVGIEDLRTRQLELGRGHDHRIERVPDSYIKKRASPGGKSVIKN
ncbi:hypothetical protein SAMN04488129_11182 [Halomonas daqiaonensis]|uniref:Uncharacterized protein n=1 Tax=Halomonas daqiaonensis TaxID=650850 RepID=A0A1H7QXG3_9GAMM|nr:hypothetical protein [Halomonas daqiaonensis]SEL52623.1 hypothetical protein SAMN04488129_11182 [Halomonas daqiaonensis]